MENLDDIKVRVQYYKNVLEPVIKGCEEQDCLVYWYKICHITLNETPDVKLIEVINTIKDILSFRLESDSPDEPYKPQVLIQDTRSRIPSDLTSIEIEFLSSLLQEILDGELKARIADILWVVRYGTKPIEYATLAIISYMKSADNLLNSNWPACYGRLERAIKIFIQTGLQNKVVDDAINIINKIHAYIKASELNTKSPYLIIRLINLLVEFRFLDNSNYSKNLEDIAHLLEKESDFEGAKYAFEVAAKIFQQRNEIEKSNQFKIRVSELLLKQVGSELSKEKSSHLRASIILHKAIDTLRDIPNQEQFKKKLNDQLRSVQTKIPSEMQTISVEIEIPTEDTDYYKKLVEKLSGQEFTTVLHRFAFLHQIKKDTIKQEVESLRASNPLHAIFNTIYYDKDNKVIAKHDAESYLKATMYYLSKKHREILAKLLLRPALQLIRLEHHIPLSYWVDAVTNHPLVPKDRIISFAYGLFHGFHGDFLSAACILVPQIENSFRYLLKNHNIDTSHQVSGGAQEESDLRHLLSHKKLEELLGEDLIFDLKGLLIEKTGSKFRSNVCHGLVDDSEFFSTSGIYLYWLVIHLLVRLS